MDAADVPYHYRDYCAHMYIDYKECRLTSGFSWRTTCAHELHAYNKCEYKEFKVRSWPALVARCQMCLLIL
jgi:NADH dehydrogenase (ubiquinone) 1 beta subcomplex subunit 7